MSLLKSKKVWLGLLAVLVVLAGLVLLTNTDELEDSVPTTGANQTCLFFCYIQFFMKRYFCLVAL